MRHRSLAVVVIGFLLLGSSGASADPTNWPQLAVIIQWLQRIDGTLRASTTLRRTSREAQQRLSLGSLRRIETYFEPVESIKDEVAQRPATGSSPRVERLRLALFAGGSFCRSDWNLLFGSVAPMMDSDLENYYDWSAVRRLNLIRTRNEKGSRARAKRPGWPTRRSAAAMPGTTPSPTRPAIRSVCPPWPRLSWGT
jgi:hypothetical protein